MGKKENAVLSIAGFDSSAGAGVLSDIKTFESLGIKGFAIPTCLTIQNESEFEGIRWFTIDQIEEQLEILSRSNQICNAKIGLIENFNVLKEIVFLIKKYHPECRLIWDPILKASAGFVIHDSSNINSLNFLSGVDIITPNKQEYETLFKHVQIDANLVVKSYKTISDHIIDLVISDGGEVAVSKPRLNIIPKHGSGCVFSSALLCYLEKGYNLVDACEYAGLYISKFLCSTDSLLGHHNFRAEEVTV